MKPYAQYLIDSGIDAYAEENRASVRMDMIRWPYGECEAGHYTDYDSNVRYLKHFLAARLRFLDREWLDLDSHYEPAGTGEKHRAEFVSGKGTESFDVEDGQCIVASPEFNLEPGEWWYNTWNLSPYTPFLPVYTDIRYEAMTEEEVTALMEAR